MIRIHLPADVESRLRVALGDVDRVAEEAALVELYRQGHITQHELGQALGLSRFEVDALLKRHHVIEDLPSPADYMAELESARKVLDQQ